MSPSFLVLVEVSDSALLLIIMSGLVALVISIVFLLLLCVVCVVDSGTTHV